MIHSLLITAQSLLPCPANDLTLFNMVDLIVLPSSGFWSKMEMGRLG